MQAKTVAEQLAAKLNTRLNYQPRDEGGSAGTGSIGASGVDGIVGGSGAALGAEETFRKYEQELEINDFPQQARWRVTSKVNIITPNNKLLSIFGVYFNEFCVKKKWFIPFIFLF